MRFLNVRYRAVVLFIAALLVAIAPIYGQQQGAVAEGKMTKQQNALLLVGGGVALAYVGQGSAMTSFSRSQEPR